MENNLISKMIILLQLHSVPDENSVETYNDSVERTLADLDSIIASS